jgi:hypothetical protein
MKKIFTAIVLFALVVLPMSVMAMTTIADNELSTVTGQAGVSINVDVTANLTIGTLGWGDADGFTGYTNAGFVGIEGLNLTVHASGRHDGAFSTGGATAIGYMFNDPITIDVGTNDSGATAVRIGLPTFHITVSTLQTDIFVSGATAAGAPTSTVAQQLGSIYIAGIDVKLGQSATPADAASFNAGYVTIAAAGAGNTGVNIGFNVAIDSVAIGTLSYGNTTSILAGSFGAAATAGYVGVTGLNLDDVNIYGGVAIGVGTLATDVLGGGVAQGTITQVNIVIANNTTVAIPGAITGNVVLAQDQTLTTGAKTLGNFYIGGITAQIVDNVGSLSPNSLVQIWAH